MGFIFLSVDKAKENQHIPSCDTFHILSFFDLKTDGYESVDQQQPNTAEEVYY